MRGRRNLYGRSNKGIFKRAGCGCTSLIFIFLLIVSLISSIDFPGLNFGTVETADYVIDMDSLSTEQFVNASYSWKFVDNSMRKRRYDITFKLLRSEVKKAMSIIDRIGNMTFEEMGLNPRLNYNDPDVQANVLWRRIYNLVYEESYPQLKVIVEGFNFIFERERMNNNDRLLFLVSFVQNIKYDRPGGVLDLLAPLQTLAEKYGDCDTKAMLLYVILERMGIDCAMMWSSYYKHAMLGVYVSTRGDYKMISGKKYFFVETTYPGWSIGELPPDFRDKRFWYISEIDKPTGYKIIKREDNRREEHKNRKAKPSPPK